MPTVENLNQETPGVPEPPHFVLSAKCLEVTAPPSNSIAYFNAALLSGLRTLQEQERFALDVDDASLVNNIREAMYVFHSLQEAIRVVITLNMQEYNTWHEEMEAWKAKVNDFGVGFAEDATPTPDDSDEDDSID
jgi:hypothetical protein